MTDIEHQPLNNDLESNSKIEDNHYADVKPTIDVQAATTVPVQDREDFYIICFFGFSLAVLAGYVNTVALIATTNVVSHHTGTVTWLGRWIGMGEWFYTLCYVIILSSFIAGAAIPGFFLEQKDFQPTRLYGLLMIVVGALIFVTEILFDFAGELHSLDNYSFNLNFYTSFYQQLGVYISSFAMGIQNGLCTQLTNAVVRTTHVTGLSTDVGMVLGRWSAGHSTAQPWRLCVLLPILFGFIGGAALGTWVYKALAADALFLAGLYATSFGFSWIFFRIFRTFSNLNIHQVEYHE